jgi:biopolymer transport protein ExbD
MAMNLGSGKRTRGVQPSMNVTPLVDVVLVLLIIFMVVTPLLTKQLWLNVPPKADDLPVPPDAAPPIVLRLEVNGTTSVNGEAVALEELGPQLQRMLNARADKVVFFDAASGVPYGRAVEVLDRVRGSGVETLAVLAEEMAPPPL